jgi:hypothetical protein
MKHVNIRHVDPFGYLVSETYSYLAAARQDAGPGDQTVTTDQAAAMLMQEAQESDRRLRIAKHMKNMSTVLDENALLKNQTLTAPEPTLALSDVPEKVWTMLASLRLAMHGVGHVRPRILADGRASTHEVELVLAEHEVAELLERLSVAGEKVTT